MTLPATGSRPGAEVPEPGPDDGFSPIEIIEVELTDHLPAVPYTAPYRQAWIVARLHTEPIGVGVTPVGEDGISPGQLAAILWEQLGEPIRARFTAAGLDAPPALAADGLDVDPEHWPFSRDRAALLADAPPISVVVCTRDRAAQLKTCLQRLEQQKYPRFEVVVVDNAPQGDEVRNLIAARAGGGVRYRYEAEPRPGLSWARNAGIAAAAHEIIAFLDDDDEPDEYWLSGIADGFARSSSIGCVSGLILPAQLSTVAEELFELLGGHIKGRGFKRDVFGRSGPQSPLFPLPPFGTGANMAFRRDVLARIGGFDVALGAGTVTSAGEDTLALTLTMLAGYEIAYEPSALMWHHHRGDIEGLSRQLHGYSVGLTAFYAALLRHRPLALPGLIKLAPSAIRYLRAPAETPDVSPELLASLDRRHLQGLLAGPRAYVASAYKQRRVSVREPS